MANESTSNSIQLIRSLECFRSYRSKLLLNIKVCSPTKGWETFFDRSNSAEELQNSTRKRIHIRNEILTEPNTLGANKRRIAISNSFCRIGPSGAQYYFCFNLNFF